MGFENVGGRYKVITPKQQKKIDKKILKLKAEAKVHYLEYYRHTGNMSCGKNLAEHISSTVSTSKREFNKIMDMLCKIDPSTPEGRL